LAVPEAYMTMVSRLFPGHAAAVKRLADDSERFQSMCEDYGLAAETLSSLEIRNLPQDVERMREYRVLVRDLERDLAEVLQVSGSKADPKNG